MSNPKLKSENYMGLGGINAKMSPYITGPMEFLDIINYDFQMPGALTQRWGSTMYIGNTFAAKVSTLTEFSRITGESYVSAGGTGFLYSGSSFITQGVSFINFSPASNQNTVATFYDVDALGGSVGLVVVAAPYLGNYRQRLQQYYVQLSGQTLDSSYLSFTSQNNFLFAANGQQFFRFDGVTASFIGVPFVTVNGLTTRIINSAGPTHIGVGVTGSYAFYGSFVNDRGFEGQIWPIASISATKYDSATLGGTFLMAEFDVAVPNGYNIKSVNLYSYWRAATLSIGANEFWNLPYNYLTNWPMAGGSLSAPSGITRLHIALGSTLGGITNIIGNAGVLADPIINSYYPIGFTLTSGSTIYGSNFVGNFTLPAFYPQFIESYQNRLFLAGFSSQPSTTVFSDTGEPEGYPLTNSIEVRTNDSDVLVGMRSYLNRLYFFKRKSFHVLAGDNAANFQLSQVSGQYGAINNRCIVAFDTNEKLMFLDRKGLMAFNGAQLIHLSIGMQPYFDRMNYSAALTEACMVHDKLRSQVICSIPIDGSSINNIQIVFDYIAGSWTTSQGLAASSLARIQGRNNTENAFFGSYSGIICWYGPSFIGRDASINAQGGGLTLYMKTKFNHEMGDSIEKQFRRLYINQDPANGGTNIYAINFYQDYGSSKVLSTTFGIGFFQDRLEYGIAAKALAFDSTVLAGGGPGTAIRIYGYTIEERLQRKV